MKDGKKIPAHLERLKWMDEMFSNKNMLEQHLGLLAVIHAVTNRWMINL